MSTAPRKISTLRLTQARRDRSRWWGVALLASSLAVSTASEAAPPSLEGLPSPDELPSLDELPPEPTAPSQAAAPSQAVAPAPAPASSQPPTQDEAAIAAEPEPEPEPEPDPRLETKTLAKAKWIKHEVLPGERLDEIASRYQVRKESLIRWNKLDADKPKIYAGRKLAVYTKHIPPPQQKLVYTVQFGDTWTKIAETYRVDPDHLRKRWNPKVSRKFKAGQEIVIWIDPASDPDLLREGEDRRSKATGGTSSGRSGSTSLASEKLPTIALASNSMSVGKPNRGKIQNPIAMPSNASLYTLRKPDEAYGSSHALHNLQLAIANFRRDTGYKGELVIGAISKKGGGRLKPHSSHQSGRDVDIRLPLRKAGGNADHMDDVDWDAAWGLIRALAATGEVQYIFLTTDRQKKLHAAAKRAGASKDMLERMIQYPNKKGSNQGLVRHEPGHTAHIHVRFSCAANETRCESY